MIVEVVVVVDEDGRLLNWLKRLNCVCNRDRLAQYQPYRVQTTWSGSVCERGLAGVEAPASINTLQTGQVYTCHKTRLYLTYRRRPPHRRCTFLRLSRKVA